MPYELQLQNAAAVGFSILPRYHNGERSEKAKAMMAAEIETLVGWLMELDLPAGVVESEILRPVEDYILARYGHEAGPRLNAEFLDAFERFGLHLLSRK